MKNNLMTQDDKQLLLKDLSARLPYGVVVETQLVNAPRAKYPVLKVLKSYMLCDFMLSIENVILKPYLRPMSSMTEEEKAEYCDLQDKFLLSSQYPVNYGYALFDWLNANHFDYRGLIEKGLAISITKENNPYNK